MRAIVLGAGISGLTLAYRLKQQGLQVTVLERSPRVGGCIQSVREDGYLFELGPRSCRPSGNGLATVELALDLGLKDLLLSAAPSAHKRYLFSRGSLQSLSIFRGPRLAHLWRSLWRERKVPRGGAEDVSIHDFFSRRLSPWIAELYGGAVVTGIYAGDPKRLSMPACFPRLWELEQKYGSLLKGMKRQPQSSPPGMEKTSLFSFVDGMETLPKAIAARLSSNLVLEADVRGLSLEEGRVRVHCADRDYEADHLYAAIPAANLMSLLPADKMTGFGEPETASVAVVNFGYPRPVLPTKGFGYLIPPGEGNDLLGVVWDSCSFPSQSPGKTVITAMLGGVHRPDLLQRSPEELMQIVQANLYRQLRIVPSPQAWRVTVAHHAIPQYTMGHLSRLAALQASLAELPVTILGNSFYGVAVNDCIAKANMLARTGLGR